MNKISKNSIITKDVELGENITIWHYCNIYGAKIGNNVSIGSYTEIRKKVIIGNNTRIQAFVFIPEGINIGKNVFIGPHVVFTNDKYPKIRNEFEPLKTYVEDNVSIGAGAVILPGIKIGKGASIGAGSVVVKNVKACSMIYGNPAKQHKTDKRDKKLK